MLAIAPNSVNAEMAVSEKPSFPEHIIYPDSRKFMKNGIIGDATKADSQKGKAILKFLIQEIIENVKQLNEKKKKS